MELTKEETQAFAHKFDISFETANCILICADSYEEAEEEMRIIDEEEEFEEEELEEL